MLYLIKDRDYLKIGYASNIKDRMKSYKTHTLYTELLDVKPGSTTDERNLHKLCSKYLVELEWFKNCEEVLSIWRNYEPEVIKDLDIIKNIIEKADEELSRVHLELFKNWPVKPKSVLSILNSINWQRRRQAIKSLDFDYPELDKYKNLERDYNDLVKITEAFEGKMLFRFYIDEYEYTSERTLEDDNMIKTTMVQIKHIKKNESQEVE